MWKLIYIGKDDFVINKKNDYFMILEEFLCGSMYYIILV